MPALTDIILHAILGGIFAGTGACIRGVCAHTHWQHAKVVAVVAAVVLIFIEATVMVWAVG
jgi:hypothetical protein